MLANLEISMQVSLKTCFRSLVKQKYYHPELHFPINLLFNLNLFELVGSLFFSYFNDHEENYSWIAHKHPE